MTKGITPQTRYDNQSADERACAQYVADKYGGLTTPPTVEWIADPEWCYDHDIEFNKVVEHAKPKSQYRLIQIPRIDPPITLDDMWRGPEALTERSVKYSAVVQEQWQEVVKVPTRIEYNQERNVLAIWYRQEIHRFSIWIGDDQ